MGLRSKLNLLLLGVALLGAAVFALAATPFLNGLAREEVVQSSRIMMESAAGARTYTSEQVAPLLEGDIGQHFHPQAVSAYAATKSFAVLHARFPDYSYREVALNPTNLDDRPQDWEADIVQYFRANPGQTEVVNERQTFRGPVLTLSRPIAVDERCLECHDTPARAPASMLAAYGPQHGFGWRAHEIVGAQIVSVPMSVAFSRAGDIRVLFIGLFLGVFLFLAIVLNLGLGFVIIRPVMSLSRIAEDVSLGKADVPEYTRKGKDQIATLVASFNRMRRSLEEAMRMLSKR
jgi:protein-histidine pros-kinase